MAASSCYGTVHSDARNDFYNHSRTSSEVLERVSKCLHALTQQSPSLLKRNLQASDVVSAYSTLC